MASYRDYNLKWPHFFIIYLFMGLTTTALPSFDDVIASIPICRAQSMSSLKNGNTGYLIETVSVFFITFMAFCIVSLSSIVLAAISSHFFLAHQAIQVYTIVLSSKMSARPCVYFSSRLLVFCFPIDNFQHKFQLLEPTSCRSFKTSRLHILGCSGWNCLSQKSSHDFCTFVVLTRRRSINSWRMYSLVDGKTYSPSPKWTYKNEHIRMNI